MLMQFPKQMKKIPFEKVAPFNDNDLILALSEGEALVLKAIMDDDGRSFSIKDTITNNPSVFACTDFNKECLDFARLIDAKFERFFVSMKSKYIYFDGEEQKFLKDIFTANHLSCIVEIYIKKDGKFEKTDIESMSKGQRYKVRKQIDALGIVVVLKLPRYTMLLDKADRVNKANQADDRKAYDFFNFKGKLEKREMDKIKKIQEKHPEMKNVSSKAEFKSAYRILVRKYHPDVSSDDVKKDRTVDFNSVKNDIEFLKETGWYKRKPE